MVSTNVVCTIMIARETQAEAQANRGGQCIVIIPPIPIKSRNEEAGVCLDFRGLIKRFLEFINTGDGHQESEGGWGNA